MREPPRPNIPFIPPAVWGVIIHHAALAYHDPLDTSQELSFLEESSPLLTTYFAAQRDKRALALVSRQWYAFAVEYLYEFVWVSSAGQAKALAHTLLLQSLRSIPIPGGKLGSDVGERALGAHIRRLHIETPVLERCAPADLRAIVEHAPNLRIYSDRYSVQRSLYSDGADPRCSPEAILRLLAHQSSRNRLRGQGNGGDGKGQDQQSQSQMRRLSWTSYGEADAPLVAQRMTPLLASLAGRLQYLELSSACSASASRAFSTPSPVGPNALSTTASDTSFSLPALQALKVSLDNTTFAALAHWSMPRLTNLSVMSADFSYTGPGFASFFEAHGEKLRQLELGHSSALVEEHYLTAPPPHPNVGLHQGPYAQVNGNGQGQGQGQRAQVPLAEWCPNLREFICSADAEWHWQSPDWIAPHVLLPAHPTVELIGIRDIDVRLREDPAILPSSESQSGASEGQSGGGGGGEYWTLYQQLSSLLSASPSSPSSPFPKLRFLRDLSPTSHLMRAERPSARVLQFWFKVVERCRERGVWLEDWEGVNVTRGSLLRAAASGRERRE